MKEIYSKYKVYSFSPVSYMNFIGAYDVLESFLAFTGVYGEGEKIITKEESATVIYEDGLLNVVYGKPCYTVDHFGRDVIVFDHEDIVQENAPDVSYEVTPCFFRIHFKEEAIFYRRPIKEDDSVKYPGPWIYTLGKTGSWYKVFYNGEVCFVNEENPNIAHIEQEPVFPNIVIDVENQDEASLCSRVKYQLSLIPYPFMKILLENKLTILVTDQPQNHYAKYHDNVSGCFLYYRENNEYKAMAFELQQDELSDTTYLERSLLHEIGHALDYMLDLISQKLPDEAFEQGMPYLREAHVRTEEEESNYYHAVSSKKEYFANSFRCYVVYPNWLSLRAPLTRDFFESDIFLTKDKEYKQAAEGSIRASK